MSQLNVQEYESESKEIASSMNIQAMKINEYHDTNSGEHSVFKRKSQSFQASSIFSKQSHSERKILQQSSAQRIDETTRKSVDSTN